MRRRLPFITPASLIFAFVLVLGLAFAVWKTGGLGINPGPLSAQSRLGLALQGFTSHAAFEQDCRHCHQSLDFSQTRLCLACHVDIGQQVTARTGFHGSLAPGSSCAGCHPDHRGRSFDPSAFALAGFKHNQTRFSLTGAHLQAACTACHTGNQYQLVSIECVACHAEPKAHAGVFDKNCTGCHTTTAWKPATLNGAPYDHTSATFQLAHHSLDYQQQPITCSACHQGGTSHIDQQTACVNCHASHDTAFMLTHQSAYGADCLVCHDGVDRLIPFDHARFFPLDGKHTQVACAACHVDQKFRGLTASCAGCHADPPVHAGVFGPQCQDCHTTQAWKPALLQKHTFPLDHGGSELNCLVCHPKTYTQYTCYACHDHLQSEIVTSHARVNIAVADLSGCAVCHPAGKK